MEAQQAERPAVRSMRTITVNLEKMKVELAKVLRPIEIAALASWLPNRKMKVLRADGRATSAQGAHQLLYIIKEKLDVTTTNELCFIAYERGWVVIDDSL